MELKRELMNKAVKLLGIEKDYTNLNESAANNQTTIAIYRELYRIEQAFRIYKSDLQQDQYSIRKRANETSFIDMLYGITHLYKKNY